MALKGSEPLSGITKKNSSADAVDGPGSRVEGQYRYGTPLAAIACQTKQWKARGHVTFIRRHKSRPRPNATRAHHAFPLAHIAPSLPSVAPYSQHVLRRSIGNARTRIYTSFVFSTGGHWHEPTNPSATTEGNAKEL